MSHENNHPPTPFIERLHTILGKGEIEGFIIHEARAGVAETPPGVAFQFRRIQSPPPPLALEESTLGWVYHSSFSGENANLWASGYAACARDYLETRTVIAQILSPVLGEEWALFLTPEKRRENDSI